MAAVPVEVKHELSLVNWDTFVGTDAMVAYVEVITLPLASDVALDAVPVIVVAVNVSVSIILAF